MCEQWAMKQCLLCSRRWMRSCHCLCSERLVLLTVTCKQADLACPLCSLFINRQSHKLLHLVAAGIWRVQWRCQSYQGHNRCATAKRTDAVIHSYGLCVSGQQSAAKVGNGKLQQSQSCCYDSIRCYTAAMQSTLRLLHRSLHAAVCNTSAVSVCMRIATSYCY
jgi:hypothetical protein